MARILMAAYTNYKRDPRVRREAEALAQIGHEVVFLASRLPGEARQEEIQGVTVIRTRVWGSRRTSTIEYMINYASFFLALMLHLLGRPRRYDLIHVNNMPDFLVFAAWLPRLLGRPVIHDVHDLMPEIFAEKFASGDRHWLVGVLKLQERWAGNFASAVLTVEDRLRDILSRRGIPKDKISVLMNLPDDRIFAPAEYLSEKGPNDRFVLVYHGTLARRLGLDVAINAMVAIRDQIPNAELRIIGAGEEREALLQLTRQLRLERTVTFSEGFVPVEQIPALIGDADVGLVPLRMSDGTDIMLPTKLLEYVTIGIPCVAPKTGTIARYFDDGMVQFFEAENADSLAAAVLNLYWSPARRAALVQQANERFVREYRWSAHKKVYTNLVERLLEA